MGKSRVMTRCECASEERDFFVCPNCGRAYPKMDWLNILSITFGLALFCLALLYFAALYRPERYS
jgi:hypothetical protein